MWRFKGNRRLGPKRTVLMRSSQSPGVLLTWRMWTEFYDNFGVVFFCGICLVESLTDSRFFLFYFFCCCSSLRNRDCYLSLLLFYLSVEEQEFSFIILFSVGEHAITSSLVHVGRSEIFVDVKFWETELAF
uniref:Transmembrane protein n=1 Tax=Cacopsylla melanoneura TaxID=428564 RepID=A0A8D8XPC1_9HEMI